MHNYENLRKQNRSILFPVVALVLCVVLSGSLLISRLVDFTARQQALMVPLTQSNGVTSVTASQRPQAAIRPQVSLLSAGGASQAEKLTANPGFQVEDENTIWSGQTDVEIFRASYENGEGKVTIQSGNGDQVIAPGTSNEYNFTLHNTGNVALDYTLRVEAYFSNGEYAIPVEARLVDYTGQYLVGSADSYADVLDLNDVDISGSISAGYIAPYTLQWQWPFDGEDEYDTFLGNLAGQEDLTLTIEIHTTAEYGGEGGLPDTGDNSRLMVPAVLMVGSFGGLLLVLLLPKRQRRERHEK